MTKPRVIKNSIRCPICGRFELHDFIHEKIESDWPGWEGIRVKVSCFFPACKFSSYRTLTPKDLDNPEYN